MTNLFLVILNSDSKRKRSEIGLHNNIRLTIPEMFQNALKFLNHHNLIIESSPNITYHSKHTVLLSFSMEGNFL